MLNPDGVAAGNFRHDLHGNNLNRCYVNPDPAIHPSIHGLKEMLLHDSRRPNGLKFYLDLHAHANKRGIFAYGKPTPGSRDTSTVQYTSS